jgi:hypothetical protein
MLSREKDVGLERIQTSASFNVWTPVFFAPRKGLCKTPQLPKDGRSLTPLKFWVFRHQAPRTFGCPTPPKLPAEILNLEKSSAG